MSRHTRRGPSGAGRPSESSHSFVATPGSFLQAQPQANATQYNAAGQLTSLWMRDLGTESSTYNVRGQLTRITLPGQMDLEYRYSATADDGRATAMKNHLSGEDVQYQYDSFGRLTQALEVALPLPASWGQSFSYDGFGNLLSKAVVKGSAPVMSLTVDPNTNRTNSPHFGYDASGNMTSMPNPVGGGAQTLGYDHDSRVISVTNSSTTETYTYNHRNQRVSRTAGGQTDYYLYGAVGEMVGRYRVRTSSFARMNSNPSPPKRA